MHSVARDSAASEPIHAGIVIKLRFRVTGAPAVTKLRVMPRVTQRSTRPPPRKPASRSFQRESSYLRSITKRRKKNNAFLRGKLKIFLPSWIFEKTRRKTRGRRKIDYSLSLGKFFLSTLYNIIDNCSIKGNSLSMKIFLMIRKKRSTREINDT